MKIFQNADAKRKFVLLYEQSTPAAQSAFGERCRNMAKSKIESLDDALESFYLTEQDVENCYYED